MDIIRTLSEPKWAKIQILLFIQLVYVYNPFRRWFARVYRKCLPKAERRQVGHSYAGISPTLGFSKQNPLIIIYKRLSGCYMVYVILRTFLPLESIITLFNPSMPAHCFILGRFMLLGPMPKNFGALICMYHLFWRICRGRLDKYCKTEMAAFILCDEDAVTKNYHLEGDEFVENKLSGTDAYLSRLMYYLVEFKDKVVYRLRPNRNKETRDNLLLHCSYISTLIFIAICAMVLICAPPIIYSAANDIQYVEDYPGCYPLLDKLYENQQLYWYSVTVKNHKIFSSIFDAVENIFIWCDNCIAASFTLALPYLLDRDMRIYWRHLHKRVEKLVFKAELRSLERRRGSSCCRKQGKISVKLDLLDQYYEDRSIEVETYEVQQMLHDFFIRVKYVDTHISGISSMSVLIWLSYFSCRAYLQITQPEQVVQIIIVTLATCIMSIIMLVISLFMFSFRRNNLRTHILICSLMAYDMSSYKAKYMPILEYYVEKNQAGYTIQGRPYTPTTLLTIVSWTFSCAALVDNFARSSAY